MFSKYSFKRRKGYYSWRRRRGTFTRRRNNHKGLMLYDGPSYYWNYYGNGNRRSS